MDNNVFTTLRAEQFPQLDKLVYADWTGAALPPISLIDGHHQFLRTTVLGNPHSDHAPSARAMDEIMTTRTAILRFFNADPDEYEVIFTSGATAAIRLLENFKFEGGELLLTVDNHNSVNGLRETARRGGAVHRYAPITSSYQIDEGALKRMLSFPRSTGNKLFVYPAKSNYTGHLHDLSWVNFAQQRGWYVMLDAAAYLANNRLDLSLVKPDFVPMSFYKIFGFPTGLGALLIRRSAYGAMHKKHFAGGSILLVSVVRDFFAHETIGYARYEDGTVDFAMIPAVKRGLDFMTSLGDGPREHATRLAGQLYDELQGLRVGQASIVVHSLRGSDTATFSVKIGDKIEDPWLFEQAANRANICIRTGCFCNPGVNEKVLGYSIEMFEHLYNDAVGLDAITLEKLREYSGDKTIGTIRASFGYANNEADVLTIVNFTRQYLSDRNRPPE